MELYGEYTVAVEGGGDNSYHYHVGFAENPSDALYKALNMREEEFRREEEERLAVEEAADGSAS